MFARRLILSPYVKQNCKNITLLDPVADFVQFVLSLSGKINVGVHID